MIIVVLIPKIDNPATSKNLGLLSWCNVIYKIISKVLANMFKRIIPKLIFETQSAFVLGRLIADNVLLAVEVMHYMKCKGGAKMGMHR